MLKKIKESLFGENFKAEFIGTFKKSVIFLIIGLIGIIFFSRERGFIFNWIGCISIVIFGLFWAKRIFDIVTSIINIPLIRNNAGIKWIAFVFLYVICAFCGYFLFIISTVRYIVAVIKSNQEKTK